MKEFGKIAIAIGSIIFGTIIGGDVLYTKGMRSGGQKVIQIGRDIYSDFDQKLVEYEDRLDKETEGEE